MEITEVRIKLVGDKREKLKAFCSITFDNAFVVRDLKIIEGSKGLFVAMPSRKLTLRCDRCGAKNPVRSNYCFDCGREQPQVRGSRGREGRLKLHADIAHPINSQCRDQIQSRVLRDYENELSASREPGYEPMALDDYDDFDNLEENLEKVPETVATRSHDREERNRLVPEKSVEGNEAPPDDNFGVGIF